MDLIDFPIDRINLFLEDHTFEVLTQPTHDEEHSIRTNVKVELTGVKDYISIGEFKPYVQYTMYILPSNEESDMWYSAYAQWWGKDVKLSTKTNTYRQISWVMNHLLSNFLKYFGVEKSAICTRVINEVKPMKLT